MEGDSEQAVYVGQLQEMGVGAVPAGADNDSVQAGSRATGEASSAADVDVFFLFLGGARATTAIMTSEPVGLCTSSCVHLSTPRCLSHLPLAPQDEGSDKPSK